MFFRLWCVKFGSLLLRGDNTLNSPVKKIFIVNILTIRIKFLFSAHTALRSAYGGSNGVISSSEEITPWTHQWKKIFIVNTITRSQIEIWPLCGILVQAVISASCGDNRIEPSRGGLPNYHLKIFYRSAVKCSSPVKKNFYSWLLYLVCVRYRSVTDIWSPNYHLKNFLFLVIIAIRSQISVSDRYLTP